MKKNHTAKTPPSARRPESPPLMNDGYSNAAVFPGDDALLFTAGTFVRSGLTSDPDLLTAMYRESWLTMRIIDMPSEDMTRAWYRLSAALPDAALHALRSLEARHSVKQEITNALRWARLYGGSLALMVVRGEEDRLDQPLIPDLLLPDCFQGLLVLDRAQGIEPSPELVSDLDDPDFGLPVSYTVNLDTEDCRSVTLHHSRVLRFVGRELPHTETVRENFWGASEMEHIQEELMKRSAASANIAQLLFQANITTLKMSDFGDLLASGTEQQKRDVISAMQMENRFRTSFGVQLLSKDDAAVKGRRLGEPRLFLRGAERGLRAVHDGYGRRGGDPRDEAFRPLSPGHERHRGIGPAELLRHDRLPPGTPAPSGPGEAPAGDGGLLLGICAGGSGVCF